jgi:hypothetical protein
MEYNGMNWGMVNQAFLISNDAIHVQVEGGWEDSNAKGIDTLETNDYMCAVHDV